LKNKKKKLFCTFVDFEKAFDTVWRDTLWYKMLLNNINGNMYQVIFNMHQNIKFFFFLFYNGNKSEYFPCEIVSNKEKMYSFLFSLFLNDLEDFFIHENVPGLNSISDKLDSRLNIFMKLFIYLSMVLTWKRSLTHHSSICDVLQHDKIISIYSKVLKVCVFTSD
jgi:hypothetical protein